jgi:hypothetical protein
LALSQSTVSASQEYLVHFDVNVGAATSSASGTDARGPRGGTGGKGDPGTGTPTGSVAVKAGSRVLCRTHLSHGHGQCSLGNGELRPGSYQVVAQYSGDRNFSPSTSGQELLTVRGRSSETSTELSLSRSEISSSREWTERFSVRVSPDARRSGQPSGSVTVETHGQILCRIHLSHGQGECTLSHQLRPGSYEVVAQYSGDGRFSPSTSGQEHLTVRRH